MAGLQGHCQGVQQGAVTDSLVALAGEKNGSYILLDSFGSRRPRSTLVQPRTALINYAASLHATCIAVCTATGAQAQGHVGPAAATEHAELSFPTLLSSCQATAAADWAPLRTALGKRTQGTLSRPTWQSKEGYVSTAGRVGSRGRQGGEGGGISAMKSLVFPAILSFICHRPACAFFSHESVSLANTLGAAAGTAGDGAKCGQGPGEKQVQLCLWAPVSTSFPLQLPCSNPSPHSHGQGLSETALRTELEARAACFSSVCPCTILPMLLGLHGHGYSMANIPATLLSRPL